MSKTIAPKIFSYPQAGRPITQSFSVSRTVCLITLFGRELSRIYR
jgi:hypothetical protein